MGWEHRTAHIGALELHYVTAGTGPLVLLLHGFPDFWYSWRYQLPALSQSFQVIAPDLRGYNCSPSSGPFDIETLLADIMGLIDHLGHRQAALVGHDWGGALAWMAAARHPERVTRLAALNIPHPTLALQHLTSNPLQMLRSWYMLFFQLPYLPELILAGGDYALPLRAMQINSAPGAFSAADAQHYRQAFRRTGLHGGIEYYRQAFRSMLRGALRTPTLVTVPTLHLWGLRDPWLGKELLTGTERYVTDYQRHVIEWAGHWVHSDAAEQVNRYLLAFLRGEDLPLG